MDNISFQPTHIGIMNIVEECFVKRSQWSVGVTVFHVYFCME